MKLLYHPRRVNLGFEAYVEPDGFNRKEQPVDIYDVFCRYYRRHRNAKWIYAVNNTVAATKPTGGTSYRYGYELSGVRYVADLASGDTITWNSSATKRWVITNHTSTSLMACSLGGAATTLNQGAEWLYCGPLINDIATSSTNAWAVPVKWIHVSDLSVIDTYTYCAHYGNTYLSGKLYLSESATKIGPSYNYGNSFAVCTGLTGVCNIPDSVVTIGRQSFWNCSGFTGLTIGNSVVEIGEGAYLSCTNMTGTLTLPETLTTIGTQAFYNTSFTGTLNIPKYLTSCGYGAFSLANFSDVSSDSSGFEISDRVIYDVTETGKVKALYGVRNYSGTLTIRGDTTEILWQSFVYNNRTGSLEIPNTVTTIGGYAFAYCYSMTGTLTFEATSTLINCDHGAFWYARFTGTLLIPDSLKIIKWRSFTASSGWTTLDLGSVETIEADSMDCATWAGNLHIPSTVSSLALGAFGTNKNFSTITSDAADYPAEDNVLYDCKTPGNVIAHLNARAYSGTLTLKSTTTRVYANCFYYSARTGACNIPSSVVTLDSASFALVHGFTVFNLYPITAPSAASAFSNYNKALHIPASNSGYDVAPWTNTAIFSSITADL